MTGGAFVRFVLGEGVGFFCFDKSIREIFSSLHQGV